MPPNQAKTRGAPKTTLGLRRMSAGADGGKRNLRGVNHDLSKHAGNDGDEGQVYEERRKHCVIEKYYNAIYLACGGHTATRLVMCCSETQYNLKGDIT